MGICATTERARLRPTWATPAFGGLLAATAFLYLWDLGASGWANAFYSAAVQAGTRSWKAFFFGSLDASNFITVDKSPGALWVMEASARLLGLSSWSVLVPQALEGVTTVALVYACVRRWFGPAAGLLAGAVVALTPVAALMFRFNNPDALLVLLLTAATYAALRAVESGRTGWLVLAGALIGSAFLAKMLQAFLIVPVVFLVYLVAGRPRLARRLWQEVLAGAALLLAAGWWVAVVQLVPAASRPYIGGSQDDSVLDLVLGYNGFGRLTGQEAGSVGGFAGFAGGLGGGSRWGATGWARLFNWEFGAQASWLLPAALILLAAGLWLTRGRSRTDVVRAALLIWGGTLLVTGAVFSFSRGIIHPYYTVALAPPIGALIGMGAAMLWSRRSRLPARLALAAALVAACGWAFALLGRSPGWYPALRGSVLTVGLLSAALLVLAPPAWRCVGPLVAVAGLAAALAGPAAYTLATVATPHGGAIPLAGPGAGFGGGFGAHGGGPGPRDGRAVPFQPRGIHAAIGRSADRPARMAMAAFGPWGAGLLDSSRPGPELVGLLETGAGRCSWVAATVDANNAAGYQLATGDPVMAIGGFNGTDPAPSLGQFQAFVREGRIHYFIAGAGGPGGATSGTAAGRITSWVEAHFSPRTVDGVRVYELTRPRDTVRLSATAPNFVSDTCA